MSAIPEFNWPVRVYYEDTDAGGVVYYANYLKFMERARTEMLRHHGWEQDRLASEDGVLFVVSRAMVEYRRPARFNDALIVVSRIARLARASMEFEQEVRHRQGGAPLCVGQVRVACVTADHFKACPIPKHLRESFS